MRVRFGDFILDTDRREVLRGSKAVHLPPKALQVLEILAKERPKAISQQELYDRLWPDTFVEKSNVHNVVYQLREALSDREQAIIRTVYGFGFSFVAAAVEDRPERTASWQIVVGDHEFDLKEGENIVGRERDATIRINDRSISRHHARIVVSAESVRLEDLGSKNGTSVHGRRIRAINQLYDGDLIVFGTVAATLRAVHPAATTDTSL